ncbi:MAG: hypothetical protein J6B34_01250 [Clostridia bacterium]|nr:hypothetical protein [Clostridia bacterium]
MKNLFSFDINDTTVSSLNQFTLREIDEDMTKRQEELNSELNRFEKQWRPHFAIVIIRFFLVLFGGLLLISAFNSLVRNGSDAFSSPIGIILPIVSLVIVGLCSLSYYLEYRKKIKIISSEEYITVEKNAKSAIDLALSYLKVPENALKTDVFCYYYYKEENGEKRDAAGHFKYLNVPMYIFKENDTLCIADVGAVFGIDINSIKGISERDEKVTFTQWNKEIPFSKEPYKEYKITLNSYGVYTIRKTCVIKFEKDADEYEILIPHYDIEPITKLLKSK